MSSSAPELTSHQEDPFVVSLFPELFGGRASISAVGACGAKPRRSPAASAASPRPCCACLPSSVMFLERFWVQISQMWPTTRAWSLLGHCSRWGGRGHRAFWHRGAGGGSWAKLEPAGPRSAPLCSPGAFPAFHPASKANTKPRGSLSRGHCPHGARQQPPAPAAPFAAPCPSAAACAPPAVPQPLGAGVSSCSPPVLVLSGLPGWDRAALCWSRKDI